MREGDRVFPKVYTRTPYVLREREDGNEVLSLFWYMDVPRENLLHTKVLFLQYDPVVKNE